MTDTADRLFRNPPTARVKSRTARPDSRSRTVHQDHPSRDVKFQIEIPKSLEYERNSIGQNFLQALYVPILSALPGNTKDLIRHTGKGARGFIDNVKKHQSVEAMYTGQNLGLLQPLWENTRNVRSMPNRLRIVTRELTKELETRSAERDSRQPIRIASIGSGSARSVLEAIENGQIQRGTPIELTFVDKDSEALAYSEQLQKAKGIKYPTKFVTSSGFDFLKNQPENQFDIVEMVGLMDYFKDRNVTKYFEQVNRVLTPGGTIVTGNIIPNLEQHFVGKAIGWNGMEYRQPDKLAGLIDKAGLKDIHVIVEPLRIHAVATARKV